LKTLSIILIVIGILLTIIGAMFKILDWPDLFKGIISGPIFMIIGGGLLLLRKKKTT
jgi:hypothetical protein